MKRYLILALLAMPAMADIYKHVDAEGRITYSNVPIKGAKKLDLGPIPLGVPAPRSSGGGKSSGGSNARQPTPASFPRVDAATQHSRDQTKLQILQDELGNEQRLLAQAKQKAATTPADTKQRDNVLMHEKNIETLHKEIARVK